MSMIPAPNCWSGCPNPQGIYDSSVLQGTGTCPPTHPNTSPPPCAQPMIGCSSCQGGYPVSNMFPGPSCPPGWQSTPQFISTIAPGVNPCVITPPPPPPTLTGITISFTKNINSGLSRFGCSFLYNRHSVQQSKLQQLQSAGTNPLWQQMLKNRINYINDLINTNCIMQQPVYPTQPPLIPINPNTAVANPQMMNLTGTEWQEDGYSGTQWQDANLNASGTDFSVEETGRPPGGRYAQGGQFSRPPTDLVSQGVSGSARRGEYNPDVPITNRGSGRSEPKFMGGSEPGTFMNRFDGGDEYSNLTERHHLKPQKRTGQITDDQIIRVSEVIGTWMN